MNTCRSEIGFFTVKMNTGEIRKIVISQDVVSHYDKDQTYSGKYFNLDDIYGPAVVKTADEDVFRTVDGIELRKR